MEKEKQKFIELFRLLPVEKQIDLYFMIVGLRTAICRKSF